MDKFLVYPGIDGTVVVVDVATGLKEITKAPKQIATGAAPMRVRQHSAFPSHMFTALAD